MVINSLTFSSPINTETSYTSSYLGEHKSTMDLHTGDKPEHCFIEWNVHRLEMTEIIGIWLENVTLEDGKYKQATLIDYDGVFSLPSQAIKLLRMSGITVSDDFI